MFVFTKYDKLTEMIESNWVDVDREYCPADVEAEAKNYLLVHCVRPIQNFTLQGFTYIAVSSEFTVLKGFVFDSCRLQHRFVTRTN